MKTQLTLVIVAFAVLLFGACADTSELERRVDELERREAERAASESLQPDSQDVERRIGALEQVAPGLAELASSYESHETVYRLGFCPSVLRRVQMLEDIEAIKQGEPDPAVLARVLLWAGGDRTAYDHLTEPLCS